MEGIPRQNSESYVSESQNELDSHPHPHPQQHQHHHHNHSSPKRSEELEVASNEQDMTDSDDEDSEVTTASEDESDDDDDNHSHDDYDLATRITNHLKNDEYVCLICTCEMETDSKFWPCSDCYRVYHVECIDGWSKRGSSTDDNGNWKCPACNTTHVKQKFQNRCWCKKVINPDENEESPGSCGQTCGAKLQGCVHRCTLPCHPGPHASCNALGPEFKCHCGNHSQQWPCVLTPYVEGWQCDDVCPEYMACEIHKCNKVCHEGLCGKCEEFMESKCYCGKTTDMVKCHARKPQRSFGKGKKGNNWVGNFQCFIESEVHYDCNKHTRTVPCQPVNKRSLHCPLSVDIITTCHCGQTPIDPSNPRNKCTDPIPTCDEICNKTLPCGHSCKWKCHEGECSPCYESPKVKCRCGNHEFIVPCKFVQSGELPTCARKCFAMMSCRRHTCNRICCANEQTALARERVRKRNMRVNAARPSSSRGVNESFEIEANHVCLEICNKKLTCGNPDHICKRTCHAGSCSPCLESSNEDLVCHCGKTVMMAPIRCGRKLPPCEHQCVRELSCGHAQMPHHCHEDNVTCLKCTKTVEKYCNCGKTLMKAMCYQDEVFCPERCCKPLSCKHRCMMPCHKESEDPCECTSICGLKKKFCSHVDRRKCHYPDPCNIDNVPCSEKVQVSCKCGRIKKDIPCGANQGNESRQGSLLDCEISCVMKEREERLQAAFGISSTSTSPTISGPSLEDLPYIADTLRTTILQNRWCLNIESTFKNFVNTSTDRTYHFKPMRREQRKFLHEMAEAYHLKSEAHDPEPRRSIVIKRTEQTTVPEMSLMEAVKHYQKYVVELKAKAASAAAKAKAESQNQTIPTTAPVEEFAEFNAISISDCIHGITLSDLQSTITTVFEEQGIFLKFELKWENSDLYMVYFERFMRFPKNLENKLKKIVIILKELLKSHFLANTVQLVKINEFGVIQRVSKDEDLQVSKLQGKGDEDQNMVTSDTINDDNRETKTDNEQEVMNSTSALSDLKISEGEEVGDEEDFPISMSDYMETEEDKLKEQANVVVVINESGESNLIHEL